MLMFHSYASLPEGKSPENPTKPPFSYGFPMVFPLKHVAVYQRVLRRHPGFTSCGDFTLGSLTPRLPKKCSEDRALALGHHQFFFVVILSSYVVEYIYIYISIHIYICNYIYIYIQYFMYRYTGLLYGLCFNFILFLPNSQGDPRGGKQIG